MVPSHVEAENTIELLKNRVVGVNADTKVRGPRVFLDCILEKAFLNMCTDLSNSDLYQISKRQCSILLNRAIQETWKFLEKLG